MRRFTSKNHLVTLSEINITPLLDLAFVLLIIFVITTPLLENTMEVKLPDGGKNATEAVDPKDIKTVEINRLGKMKSKGREIPNLAQLKLDLAQFRKANPEAVLAIRADGDGAWKYVSGVMNAASEAGFTRFDAKMNPIK